METPPMPENEKQESGAGAMIGIAIVVLLLAIGGIYLLITQEMKLRQAPSSDQASL